MSPNDCTNNIINIIDHYTKELYSAKKILLFDDYEITEVIKQSNVTKQWDERFNAVKKESTRFLDLSISKKSNTDIKLYKIKIEKLNSGLWAKL